MTTRRSFLLGATALLAAPAVVQASSLMKLWVPPEPKWIEYRFSTSEAMQLALKNLALVSGVELFRL